MVTSGQVGLMYIKPRLRTWVSLLSAILCHLQSLCLSNSRNACFCVVDTPNVCRDSSVGTATGYGLDGPGIESRWGARFSAPVQNYPGAHPASYTMGTTSFPGVKRPGCGLDPPSSAEVKERVELYLYSLCGPSWPILRWTYLYLYLYTHQI